MKHTRRNAVLKRMCMAAGLALFALVGVSAGADEPEAGNNPCIDRGVTICQPGSLSMYDLKFTPANSCSNACTIICLGDTITNVCVTVVASDGHYYQDSTCPQPHIVADYACPVEYSVTWKIEGPPYAATGSGDCTGSFAPTASGHGKVTFTAVWSSPCGSCGTAGTNSLSCDYLVVKPAYLRAEGCTNTVEGVPVGESITAASTLYVTVSTTDVVRVTAPSTPEVSCECLESLDCWSLTGSSDMFVPGAWTNAAPAPTNICSLTEGYVKRDKPGCVEITVDCCDKHGLHLCVVVLEITTDPWLGIDLTNEHITDTNNASLAGLNCPGMDTSVTWQLSGPAGTVFVPAGTPTLENGTSVVYKETGVNSESYLGEILAVVSPSSGCPASTNFTVVKVNLTWQEPELAESQEESKGGFVAYNADDDDHLKAMPVRPLSRLSYSNTNDCQQKGPITGEDNLARVNIDVLPGNLPTNEVIVIDGDLQNVYVDPYKATNAVSSYTVATLPPAFWVEGVSVGGTGSLQSEHPTSKARDKVKWTVVDLSAYAIGEAHLSGAPGASVTNVAVWLPTGYENTDVNWVFVDTNGQETNSIPGCTITPMAGDPMRAVVTVVTFGDMWRYLIRNSNSGCDNPYIVARVKGADRFDSAYADVRIDVGCRSCTGVTCGGRVATFCPAPPFLGSVSTGHDARGIDTPPIPIHSPPAFGSPPRAFDLFYIPPSPGLLSLCETGAIRQVASANRLITIVAEGREASVSVAALSAPLPPDTVGPVITPLSSIRTTLHISDPSISPLVITETSQGNERVYTFTRLPDGSLVLNRAGISEEGYRTITPPAGADAATEYYHLAPGAADASLRGKAYRDFPWGRAVVSAWDGPAGSPATSYTYETDPASPDYGRCIRTDQPGGAWECLTRDSVGHIVRECAGHGSLTTRVTETSFTPLDGDNAADRPHTPRTVTEYTAGLLTRRSFTRLRYLPGGIREEIHEEAAAADAPFGDPRNRRTVTLIDSEGVAIDTLRPDGLRDRQTRVKGHFAYGATPAAFTFTADPDGPDTCDTRWQEPAAPAAFPLPNRSTRTITCTGLLGNTLATRQELYDGSGWTPIGWEVTRYDADARPTNSVSHTGAVTDTRWGCCGKEWERAADGAETEWLYDALQRVQLEVKLRGAFTNFTEYAYDAAGRTLSTSLSAGGLSQTTSNSYDTAGRLLASTDHAGLVTTYAYPDPLTSVTISPGGLLTNTTVRYPDGRAHYSEQNGIRRQTHMYGVNPDGTQWTTVYEGPAGAASPVWSRTVSDLLGRTLTTARPGFGGATLVTSNSYDTAGRLVLTQSSSAGGVYAATLYTYDSLGDQALAAQDLDLDGQIDLAGPDRVSGSDTSYESDSSDDYWQVTRSIIYPHDSSATPLTNSISRTRLTGLGLDSEFGILTSESCSLDLLGNPTISRTYVDRDARTVTQVTDTPDSTLDAIQVSVNGLTQRSISPTGVTNSFVHDALGRPVSVTDGRGNTSITHYDPVGRVDWTADAAGSTNRFGYDTLGRRIHVSDALGQQIHTAYDPYGRVIATWGAIYPVAYEYDSFGRMIAMYTYRGTNEITDYASFQSLVSSFDKTRWLYHDPTGLLTNKLYADGKGPTYTYTPDGKLATRTWARGVTTSYAYDPSGSLTNIAYSDSTPTVAFRYDRMGRQVSAITAGVSTNLYGYSLYGQLTNETITLCASAPLRETITRTTDTLGRPTGIAAGPDYAVSYAYDSLGRFFSVTSALSVVNYSYLPGTYLLSGYTLTDPVSSFEFQVSRSYEPHRDLITSVENAWGTNRISRFDYANDSLARRTRRVDNDAVTNDFGYNLRSEVFFAAMGTNSYAYDFDPIGNRRSASRLEAAQAVTNLYASNPLNQYTNILTSVPSVVNPQYDLDGNLTNGGHRVYFWDAENRLIGVDPPVIETGAISVRYAYDFMSRRVARAAYRWVGSNAYETVETTTYIFDGWNAVAETGGPLSAVSTNYYVWGLDLSGSMQGAGGIGGLLSATLGWTTSVSSAFITYDGNGNVSDLIDTNGAMVAHYEYDPFGNIVRQTGDAAEDSPFRFSTHYQDDETGLIYAKNRYYDPETGCFLSRDPIGEIGGANLYVFVLNDPTDRVDPFGYASLTHVNKGVAFYTWHMGWIDRQHIAENSSLTTAWQQLKAAQGGKPEVFDLSMAQSGRSSRGSFCVVVKPDEANKKNQLLLAWMAISHQFEAYQGTGFQANALANRLYGLFNFLRLRGEFDKIPSSFSTEDLVSNLVSFYATVEGQDPIALLDKYAGRFDDKDERLISQAIWVFGLKPQPGYQQWTPKYFDHGAFMNLYFDLSKETFGLISKEFYVIGAEAQKRLPKYIQKYGNPKFPEYFQRYRPMLDGYMWIYLQNQ